MVQSERGQAESCDDGLASLELVLAFIVLGVVLLGSACNLLGISAWLFVLAKLGCYSCQAWVYLAPFKRFKTV